MILSAVYFAGAALLAALAAGGNEAADPEGTPSPNAEACSSQQPASKADPGSVHRVDDLACGLCSLSPDLSSRPGAALP